MFWNFKQKKILSGIVIVLFAFTMLFPVSFLHAEFLRVPAPENLTAGVIFAENDEARDIRVCFNLRPSEGVYPYAIVKIDGLSFNVDTNGRIFDIPPYLSVNDFEVEVENVIENENGKITEAKRVCTKLIKKAANFLLEGEYKVETQAVLGDQKSIFTIETFTVADGNREEDRIDLLEEPGFLEIETDGKKDLRVQKMTRVREGFFREVLFNLKRTFFWQTFVDPVRFLIINLFGLREQAAPGKDTGAGADKR